MLIHQLNKINQKIYTIASKPFSVLALLLISNLIVVYQMIVFQVEMPMSLPAMIGVTVLVSCAFYIVAYGLSALLSFVFESFYKINKSTATAINLMLIKILFGVSIIECATTAHPDYFNSGYNPFIGIVAFYFGFGRVAFGDSFIPSLKKSK